MKNQKPKQKISFTPQEREKLNKLKPKRRAYLYQYTPIIKEKLKNVLILPKK